MQLFLKEVRHGGVNQPPLLLSLNASVDDEERDITLISFYKNDRAKSQWAAPFNCRIIGNAAVTTLFEGQTDHLVPVLSTSLLDSDLIMMAGRMIGHSVIHGGPTLSGLSPAVVDALMYSRTEMAASKLCLEDCSDVEHRETIRLVSEEKELESSQISELCLNWYCPVPTKETNRLLLFQQLLSHAVLGRSHAQIKQLRKGLKDTGVWPLLATRPDVAPLFFPREAEVQLTPQAILQSIKWPQSQEAYNSDDSDDDIQTGTISAITVFFRTFVENASPEILAKLVKFWTGWEVPPDKLNMEIVKSRGRNHLPTASTCYERLRIPDHYSTYSSLKSDLMVCVESVDSGFGLI
ncbi:hypothetical protein ACEWY4_020561 [Coilia grayii]|uniref:HECT-type E3 ubiquitin transferase n=1 Tax=Coilia grayii TaxID=363190 RepID=A0ABD1JCZ7_9TELE